MTTYQRHLLFLILFWAYFATTIVVAWSVPSESVGLSGLVGVFFGAAAGLADPDQIPTRVISSTVSSGFATTSNSLLGRLLLLWGLTAASPVLASHSQPPEVIWLILLNFAAVCFGYLTVALGRAFIQERNLGPIVQEAMFPGSLGLPEGLRGLLVLIRDAEGSVGTIDAGGRLLEVRSVTGEPLVAGRLARLVAVEDTALLVLQESPFEDEAEERPVDLCEDPFVKE